MNQGKQVEQKMEKREEQREEKKIAQKRQIIEIGSMSFEVARYEIGPLVGRGGYSQCNIVRKFQGFSPDHLGQEAVLKKLKAKDQTKPIEAIHDNEVRTLRVLNGEHCARFSRCFTHWKASSKKNYYILLENCSYGSLNDLSKYILGECKAFSELEIIFFLREILQAVRIMHGLKMIHRDLKLQNILIDSHFNIKLIDFGLTKIGEDGQHPTDNKYQGTPLYMSPQIVLGKDYSYEIDMWAIGIILYQLMYFQFPFKAQGKIQLTKAITQCEIKFKRKNDYADLIKIAKKLLDREQKNRPTAENLLQDPIFTKINNQKDIHKRIEKKYKKYFEAKSQNNYNWKSHIKRQFQLYYPSHLTQQQKNKIYLLIKKKTAKTQKVTITRVLHNTKYGFFFLLSNLSLYAYFNNCICIKFAHSLLSKPNLTNEQQIFCYIYKQHFMREIKEAKEFNSDAVFDEPQCGIKKVAVLRNNLFVRLTNNALQVFFNQSEKQKDDSLLFPIKIHYNTHVEDHRQIIVIEGDSKMCYKDYATILLSRHKIYAQYVKQVMEIMIDNSCISFQQMQLQRC